MEGLRLEGRAQSGRLRLEGRDPHSLSPTLTMDPTFSLALVVIAAAPKLRSTVFRFVRSTSSLSCLLLQCCSGVIASSESHAFLDGLWLVFEQLIVSAPCARIY